MRHLFVVGNYLDHQCLQDVEYLVALQNQDALIQDAVLTFQVVHQLHQLVVVVDEELHRLSKMDCYQDVVDAVDAELRYLLKMDCYLDAAQVLMELQVRHLQLHGLLRDLLLHALQLPLY